MKINKAEDIKKRVVLISPFCPPSVGGAETHLQDLYERLRREGYFVYVLTYQPITISVRGEPVERKTNLEIRRFSWIGFNLFNKLEKFPPVFNFLYLTPYLLLRSFLFVLFNRSKIDCFHAFGLNAGFIAGCLKIAFGKPAVMSTQALYNFKKGSLFARITRIALLPLDKIIAESVESKEELVKIGLSELKIVVFSHWVDQEKFKPRPKDESKKELGWEGKFIVLFVGRAIPIKGSRLMVEAARVLKDIYFAVVSNAGPEIEYLREAAKELSNLNFVEGVDYKDLWLYYDAADIFVIPSQYEEGVARVMLEALSSGTPIIGSRRGSIPSVLDNSVSILIEPVASEIIKAVKFLYDNPEELKRLSANARSYALERFSGKNIKVITDTY